MELTRHNLEAELQRLTQCIVSASTTPQRGAFLDQMRQLNDIQSEYESLEQRFLRILEPQQPYVDIEITRGAVEQHYINLTKAVNAGILSVNTQIEIRFPNAPINTVVSEVKSNGYLQSRQVARQLFQTYRDTAVGKSFRFSKEGDGLYSIVLPAGEETVTVASDRRLPPFRFSMCDIPAGEELTFVNDPSIVCVVFDDKHVQYHGRLYSLSGLAQELTHSQSLAGPKFFVYHGETLAARRERIERERGRADLRK